MHRPVVDVESHDSSHYFRCRNVPRKPVGLDLITPLPRLNTVPHNLGTFVEVHDHVDSGSNFRFKRAKRGNNPSIFLVWTTVDAVSSVVDKCVGVEEFWVALAARSVRLQAFHGP